MNGTELGLTDWQSEVLERSDATSRLTFEQAFAAHHQIVYRYAVGLTRERGLAEDVTQEVFVRLYHNFDAAQREGMIRAWLLRVCANVARNLLRGRNRSQVRDESFAAHRLRLAEPEGPDEGLDRQAEIDRTRRALTKLREPLRNCLLLRSEGLSYREIAVALGIKEASVGTLLLRARREFIRAFEKA